MVGIGGAPEGVLAAAAIKALGGVFQGRLVPADEEEFRRCEAMGLEDPLKVLYSYYLFIFAYSGFLEIL